MDLLKIRHIAEFVITHYFRVITKYLAITSFLDSETHAQQMDRRPTAHGVNTTQIAFIGRVLWVGILIAILDRTFRKLFRK